MQMDVGMDKSSAFLLNYHSENTPGNWKKKQIRLYELTPFTFSAWTGSCELLGENDHVNLPIGRVFLRIVVWPVRGLPYKSSPFPM